jgi:hypothetical protein
MPSDKHLEQTLQDLIVDICEIMYSRGYRSVPVGAIMRLIGVNAETAAQHDHEMYELGEEFEQLVSKKRPSKKSRPLSAPPNITLH